MGSTLVGPPERPPQNPLSTLTTTTNDPFINSILSSFNTTQPMDVETPHNPCLDLFFDVVPGTHSSTITQRLNEAWDHDPLTTLKLICNLRGVRGTGKSDKNGFYTAAIWLHSHHPKTLSCNLSIISHFGYFKDFPEILFRVLGLSHKKKMSPFNVYTRRREPFRVNGKKGKNGKTGKKGKKSKAMKEFRMREAKDKQVVEKEEASELRYKTKIEMAKSVVKKFNHDPEFRYLHERVSDLFADRLRDDLVALKGGELREISLAAKWCPSLDSVLDRATLLCEAVARKLFPKGLYEEYSGVEDVHYAYRVRDRLRKEVLVPLRKALELPEVFMGLNKWDEVKYNRVASVAMRNYKEHFVKHDEERFNGFLELVKSGKAKIAAGALLPHEIVGEALKGGDDGGEVAELQWKRMVKDLLEEGGGSKLGNCIGICDVSSSMEGTPMEVCVSLGILLSELSEEPWKGKVITFSENPQLHLIQGSDLYSKASFIRKIKWGMNTNFLRVLELILCVAIQAKLKPEEMIKRVFVFSDMEFDKAISTNSSWERDYKELVKKYEENGFKEAVPEIVFWNLRDSKSTPVTKKQKGVALVSGFSKNAMKLFLQGKQGDPQAVMDDALSGEEYSKLVVLD